MRFDFLVLGAETEVGAAAVAAAVEAVDVDIDGERDRLISSPLDFP